MSEIHPLIAEIAGQVATMPDVSAIASAGSAISGTADALSDVDLYVYGPEPPPIGLRTVLALHHDPHPEIDNQAFGPGDEWTDTATGLAIDLNYWTPSWIEGQLARVLDRHLPSTGYTTSFWRTILHSRPIYDPTGWFATLQERARCPYPEPLRQAIVAVNHPLLRTAHSSFRHQIERAISRRDANSVQHRTTAFLASYFDILFALNRVPHPGEKRLVAISERECPVRPANLDRLIHELIAAVPPPWVEDDVLRQINALVDPLDRLLIEVGLRSTD
jgi:Domain of unknown function (DUF4037)